MHTPGSSEGSMKRLMRKTPPNPTAAMIYFILEESLILIVEALLCVCFNNQLKHIPDIKPSAMTIT